MAEPMLTCRIQIRDKEEVFAIDVESASHCLPLNAVLQITERFAAIWVLQ